MICDKIVVFFIVFVIQQPYVAKIPHLYSACQVFQGFFAYATANIFFASANFIFAGACGNFAVAYEWRNWARISDFRFQLVFGVWGSVKIFHYI